MPTKGSKKAEPAAQPELDEVQAQPAANGSAIAPLAAASSEIAIPGLPTLDPEQYAAAVFEPFNKKLEAEAASAELIVFTEEQLLALPEERRQLAKVVDISTTAGMDLAIRFRAIFRDDVRLAGEKTRKERKAPILLIGTLLESKYKDLVAAVAPYESKFHDAIKAEEARKAEIKAAAEKAEAERVNAIRTKIAAIRNLPASLITANLAELKQALHTLAERDITEAEFSTLIGEAQMAYDAAGAELLRMMNIAAAKEAEEAARVKALAEEQARLAAEREANRIESERLAALKREADAAEAERLRVAAAERLRVAAAEQKERDRVAADTKRQLEEQVAAIEAKRKQLEAAALAEEQRRAGERAAFEAEKAAFAQQQAAADAARIAAMTPPVAVPAEVVAAAVVAQEAAPEPVCALLVPVEQEQSDAAPELTGESTIDAFDKRAVDALKMAVLDLLQTRTADEVRAMVEAELVAFGQMGEA